MSKPGPKRKSLLAGAIVWDAFFAVAVQGVLAGRHAFPSTGLDVDAKRELLAWPIRAFCACDDLASERATKVRRQVPFLDAYAEDRAFVADLLAAVTAYHCRPEQSFVDLIAKWASVASDEAETVVKQRADSRTRELLTWDEVAERIRTVERRFVASANADRIRAKEFYEEKRRRERILLHWEPHLAAWRALDGNRSQ